MHTDIALSASVISARMSDIVNITSKIVFPLHIMRKINNWSFYHDLDLCKMSNSSLLAIWCIEVGRKCLKSRHISLLFGRTQWEK